MSTPRLSRRSVLRAAGAGLAAAALLPSRPAAAADSVAARPAATQAATTDLADQYTLLF